MFSLITIEDTIQLHPIDPYANNPISSFRKPYFRAVQEAVDAKYSNTVIRNKGLALVLYDLLRVGEAKIMPDDPCLYVYVIFRLVTFNPIPGQVILGRIKSCDKEGIHISVGFFDDIFIPPANLPPNTKFDEEEKTWVWNYLPDTLIYLDPEEIVKVRVESIEYGRPSLLNKGAAYIANGPTSFSSMNSNTPNFINNQVSADESPDATQIYAMRVIASIKQTGLGCLTWWED